MTGRAGWLPNDPALPQLATALDEAAMAEVFTGLLGGRGVALQRCRVDRVKYRAGRNLSVAYVLDLQDERGPYAQRVSARLCTGGEAARRHAQALGRGPLQASRAGPALSHVASLDLSAHWWPNDAKLTAGAVLADAAALRGRWLPEVARALGLARCDGHEVELMQLVPEHRVTARVHLHGRAAAGGAVSSPTVYAKSDLGTCGEVTQAVMSSLWQSPARREGRLSMPRPLLWQPGSALHWQAAVPGRALLDAGPLPGAPVAADVGRLLASLHGTEAPAAPAVTPAGLREALHDTHALLCSTWPELAPRAGGVAAALEDGLAHLGSSAHPPCTLHGDLHPRNLMLAGRELHLIDLDSVRRGPALLDIGSWLADALYRRQLGGLGGAGCDAGRDAFLAGYAAGGGRALGARPIAWATAWQLWCQRIWRCLVNLKPGRHALIPGLLARTEVLLASRSRTLVQRLPEWVL